MKTRHYALLALVLLHDTLVIGFVTWLAPPQVIEALSAIEHALLASSDQCVSPLVVTHTSSTELRVDPSNVVLDLPRHQ